MDELKNNLFDLLKRAEKFTKSDNLYIFKGGFFLTLSSVSTGALSFIMAVVLGWLLPKEVYGNYKYLFSILGVIALFTLSGMDAAVTQAVARGQDGSFRVGLRRKIIFSFLGSLTAIGIAVYYFAKGQPLIGYGSLLMGAFLPLWGPFGLYPSYFIGKGKFHNITRANVGIQTMVALTVIITAYFSKNFLVLATANIFVQTLGSGYIIWRILSNIPRDATKDPNTHKYGFHLSIIDMLGTLSNYLDNILVFTFLGPAALAVYNFAMAPPEQMKGLVKNSYALAFPKFANKSIEDIRKNIVRRMVLFTVGVGAMVLLYILVAPLFFSLFLPRYTDSIFYSQIYALSVLVAPGYVIGAALKSTSQTKALYVTSVIGVVAEIVFIVVLIPPFGIIGAVLSQVISRVFNFIITLIAFARVKTIPNPQ